MFIALRFVVPMLEFLCPTGDDANEEIGTPTKLGRVHGSDISEMVEVRRNMSTQFDGSSLIPNTPLSGRHFLQVLQATIC